MELDRSTLFMKRRRRARMSMLVEGLDVMVGEDYESVVSVDRNMKGGTIGNMKSVVHLDEQ